MGVQGVPAELVVGRLGHEAGRAGGTQQAEISASSVPEELVVVPVRAVTATTEVIAEPELVMNCLVPSSTHSPSTSSALVRVAPASEPAPGSVSPKPARVRPATRSGSHCCFCSSVPKVRIGLMPRPDAGLEGDADRLVDPAELLDRQAEAGEAVLAGQPAPPYSSGRSQTEEPRSPIFWTRSTGK